MASPGRADMSVSQLRLVGSGSKMTDDHSIVMAHAVDGFYNRRYSETVAVEMFDQVQFPVQRQWGPTR